MMRNQPLRTSAPQSDPGRLSRSSRLLHQLLGAATACSLALAAHGQEIFVPASGSLSSATSAATSGTTITLTDNVNLTGQISINSAEKTNLTYRSQPGSGPFIITANNGSRVFNITQGGNFVFEDLTLQGNGVVSSGMAITINGSGGGTTTLAGNYTVRGFLATSGQGAINSSGGNSSSQLVLGTPGGLITFDDNESSGGGSSIRGVNVTVAGNSLFTNNRVTNNNGGAVYVTGNMTFQGDATFQGNSANTTGNANGTYGGAVHANAAGTTVSFLGDATFINNSTGHGNGGAVRANGDLTFAQAVLLENNSANRNDAINANLSVNGGAFHVAGNLAIAGPVTALANTAISSGGAMNVTGNASFGHGASFHNNSTQVNNGGAVSVGGNATFGSATFQNNSAGNTGGALYVQGNLTVGAASFLNNTAASNGGAIYLATPSAASTTSTLLLDASAGNILFQGNTANGNPNAIYLAQGSSNAGVTQRLELITGAGNTITFFDPIASRNSADAGVLVSVEKSGAGTVLFDTHDSNVYADTTVAAGTFQLANNATYGANNTVGSLTIAAGATLAGHGTIEANDVSLATGATLRAADGGTLTIDATNRNFSTGLTLAGHGTLAAGAALHANNITADGTLVLNDTTTLAADGTIAGTTANASLDSAAPINLAGNATVTAGAGHGLTIFSQLEGGSAALTKTGAGTVTLASPNEYSGGTVISAGNLVATSTVALGTGDITNHATLTLANGSTNNLAVAVSGSGQLVKSGAGNLLLSGANTYTGATVIEQGSLSLDSAGAATGLAASSGVTLASGTTLDLNGHNASLAALSGTGGTVALGNADLTVNAAAGTNQTYAGQFSGTAGSSVTKDGAGTLTLSGTAPLAAGFAGDVSIASGTLAVTGGALTTTGDVTIASGATLGLAAGTASITADQVTLQNNSAIDIVGYSASTLGAVDLITGTAPIAADLGQVTLLFEGQAVGAPSLDQYLTLQLQSAAAGTKLQLFSGLAWETTSSAHGTFNISTGSSFTTPTSLADNTQFTSSLGGWDGTTLTKTGAGTLVLGHANTYTGATSVQGGTLQFGVADAIATSSAVTLASGTTLDLANHDQSLNNVSGAGDIALGSATLTAHTATNAALSGTISGTGALVKQGAGTLTLSGANTYGGGTTVAAGGIIATNASALGSGPLVNNGGVEFAVANNGAFTGAISGNGAVTKSGTGTLALTGATGAASLLAINAGTLALGDGTASHAFTAGDVTVSSHAALTVERDSTLNVTGSLNLANDTTLNLVVGTPSPIVSANTLTIGASNTALNVTGVTGNTAMPFTLISTTGGITGAFSSVSIGGGSSSSTDYLQLSALKSANGNDYVLNMALTWLTPGATASGTFTLGDGESFDVGVVLADQAGNANWDGRSVTKAGPGTLTLSAVNTYTGATNIQAGTLRLGTANSIATSSGVNVSAGATLDLANNNQTLNHLAGAGNVTLGSAALTATYSANTTFSGVISGTGSLVKQGTAALTLSGANTYSGGTTINAGRIVVANNAALGTGTATLGANGTLEASSGTLANALSGTGTLLKSGTGTLNYTGNGTAFTGTTTVSAGTLAVNGSLRGNLTVANGAILGGTGSLGNVTVSSGGRLAPGNSIGTVTVNGNLTFADGSIYDVEIDPAAADRTNVTGAATIQNGASVNVIKAAGNYVNGTRFTILNAAGGITGQFSDLTQTPPLPFLDMFLEYETNNVILNLSRNTIAFDTYARTPNEQSTARAIEALGSQNGLYTAIVALPDEPTVRAAYNAVSGELHATTQSALLDSARLVREAPLRRGAAFGPDAAQHPYWAEVVASNGTIDSDGNAAEVDHKSFGVLAGRDFAVGDVTRAGFLVGFTAGSIEPDNTPSKLDLTSVHVGAYVSSSMEQFSLRGGAAASRHTIETVRAITVGATNETLTTRRIANTAQVFGEAGFLLGDRAAGIEPFVGGHLASIKAENFRELGGTWALRGHSATKANQAALAGVRGFFSGGARSSFNLGGTVAWQRNFGDLDTTQRLSFTGSNDFSVRGLPLTRQFLLTELNLGLELAPRTRLTFGYSGRHASEASDHAVRGTLTHRF